MAKRIITISREFGSGGRFIGEKVAKKLGIAYYDKNIINDIAEKSGLSPEYVQKNAELSPKKGLFAYAFAGRDITGKSVEDMVYEAQRKVILELADKESCVIIGRNADYILKDRDDVLNVFIYGDMPEKTKRIMGLYNVEEKEAVKMMADRRMEHRIARAVSAGGISGGVAGAVAGSAVAGKRAERKNTASKENRGNTTSSMGQRAGSKVGAVLDTKNKVKDKANAVKENIKDMPTQTAYAVYSAKEKAKSSVSDFKRGMVQEQQSRQTGRLEKQEQHRQNIADKRMELQKAQEARQAQRKADGSATTGATRPHERPATASTIPKPSVEKMQEVKRPATATTSKISEPVKTSVIKERPLSSGASDRKASQPIQPAHRQNVEKVVSQETRQNYTKDRRTKVQQTQTVQKNQQTTEKTRNLVMKKGQKKK